MRYYIQVFLCFLSMIPATSAQQLEIKGEMFFNKKPIVFIAGFDEGDNQYYTNAKRYFEEKKCTIITNKYSLEEIVCWINEQEINNIPSEIHIISHSNPWRGLSMTTVAQGDRITVESLEKNKGKIPSLDIAMTKDLKIIFHSCGLGENTILLKTIKSIIDSNNNIEIYASPFFNVFGSPYAPHYLAKYYYVFYPTAHSPGPMGLASAFSSTYQENDLDWLKSLKTKKEKKMGEAYAYRFNIPINWETIYKQKEDIPLLRNKEDIMDWVAENEGLATQIFKLNIPLEKFRWQHFTREQ